VDSVKLLAGLETPFLFFLAIQPLSNQRVRLCVRSFTGSYYAESSHCAGARPRNDPRMSHHCLPARRQLLGEGPSPPPSSLSSQISSIFFAINRRSLSHCILGEGRTASDELSPASHRGVRRRLTHHHTQPMTLNDLELDLDLDWPAPGVEGVEGHSTPNWP